MKRTHLFSLLAMSLLAGACTDTGTAPVARTPGAPAVLLSTYACTAEVDSGTLECREQQPSGGGARRALLGTGQVKLRNINNYSDTIAEIFSTEVNVRNLLSYAIGTLNGEDATGLKVYFESGPTATAYAAPGDTGTVVVKYPAGYGHFSRPDQPYYAYPEMLAPGDSTHWKYWEWRVPRQVKRFSFSVRVAAETVQEGQGPKLLVQQSAGVSGSPAVGLTFRTRGDQVPYSFAALPGYQNLTVLLNGQPIPASGTVVIDSTHVLVASADRVLQLPAGRENLLTLARAVLTSSDRPAAYQAYLDAQSALVAEVGAQEADRILGLVDFLASHPATDRALILAADQQLANRMFTVSRGTLQSDVAPPAASSRSVRIRSSVSGSVSESVVDTTDFIYVNGAYNDNQLSRRTAERLDSLVRATKFSTPGGFRVTRYYNRTYREEMGPDLVKQQMCSGDLARSAPYMGPTSQEARYRECMELPTTSNPADDYIEAARQILELSNRISVEVEQDAMILGDTIENLLNKVRKVVVVPHSQGNLMTQQAVDYIKENDPTWETDRPLCVGAVSLAAPMSSNWPIRSSELFGVVLAGDIILELGMNHFPQSWSARSDSMHVEVAEIDRLNERYGRLKAYREFIRLSWGVRIHYPLSTYFRDPQSLDRIQQGLVAVEGALHARCGPIVKIEPDGGEIEEGETLQLRAKVQLPGLQEVEPPVADFIWSMNDPQRATVSSAGLVTGVRAGGGARIMADFPGIPSRDTVIVYVKTHPFDGSWVGTYDNGYFSQQPYYSAPITLTIAGTTGTVSLGLNEDRFSGAFPAETPDPSSPYGRYATADIRNHGTQFVLNVYEHHYADPQRLPDRRRLMVTSRGLGTQLSGNIYKCYGDSYMCSWSYPIMGSVTLNRVY